MFVERLLPAAASVVNDKRSERNWWREGLKVAPKQPRRDRLNLYDEVRLRMRAEYPHQAWSDDFVEDDTLDARGTVR